MTLLATATAFVRHVAEICAAFYFCDGLTQDADQGLAR
jgi:hypothetical protein